MNLRPSMPGVVAAVNGAGFVGYLFWIAGRGRRIFFDPQGIIYLLPCVAFIFVFACLASRKGQAPSADDDPRTSNLEQRTSNKEADPPGSGPRSGSDRRPS